MEVSKRYDISGQTFGRLKVIKPIGKRGTNIVWECECVKCGKKTNATANDLRSGNKQSCGCLYKESIEKLYENHTAPWKLGNKPSKANTSGRRGVVWDKDKQKWCAQIQFKKKYYFLGYYSDFELAVKAREDAEKKLFGDFLAQQKLGEQEKEYD